MCLGKRAKTLEELQELLINLQTVLNITQKINTEHPAYKLNVRQIKDNINIVIIRINKYHNKH